MDFQLHGVGAPNPPIVQVFYVISLCVLSVYADTPGKFFVEELEKEEGEATRLLGQRDREGWADFS